MDVAGHLLEEMGLGGQGATGRQPTACPRLWVAGAPWDPNLGTVTQTFQEKWVWPRCAPKDQKEACTPATQLLSAHRESPFWERWRWDQRRCR